MLCKMPPKLCILDFKKKRRELCLSIDCQIDLFDERITHYIIYLLILLYDCVLWRFENLNIIEKLY